MNLDDWIAQHPYLDVLAEFDALIEAALDDADVPRFPAGDATPDYTLAADALVRVTSRLAKVDLPPALGQPIQEFSPADAKNAIEWLTTPSGDEQDFSPVIRLLGWRVLRRALADVVAANSVAEEVSDDAVCPTCGALAALALLVDDADGRRRRLACACCGTTWNFKRVGCPYCGAESPEQLSGLQIDDEKDFRLDVCNACHGYTKTYTGSGDPQLLLADWPTIHLDVIACERGYHRHGASLYEVDGVESVQ